MSDEVKTKFKGPGQWRSQAARLEAERDKKESEKTKKDLN